MNECYADGEKEAASLQTDEDWLADCVKLLFNGETFRCGGIVQGRTCSNNTSSSSGLSFTIFKFAHESIITLICILLSG